MRALVSVPFGSEVTLSMLKFQLEERIEGLELLLEQVRDELTSDDPDLPALQELIEKALEDETPTEAVVPRRMGSTPRGGHDEA